MLTWFLFASLVYKAIASEIRYECADPTFHLNIADQTCVSVNDQERLSFEEARSFCQQMPSGDIYQPTSEFSVSVVAELMEKVDHYWIGVQQHNGLYQTVDGEEIPFDIQWRKRDRNVRRHKKCVAMSPHEGGTWSKRRCVTKRPFVCQTPAVKVTPPNPYRLASCDFESTCPGVKYLPLWELVNSTSGEHFIRFNSSQVGYPDVTLSFPNVSTKACLKFRYQGRDASMIIPRKGIWGGESQNKAGWEVESALLPPPAPNDVVTINVNPRGNEGFALIDDIIWGPRENCPH